MPQTSQVELSQAEIEEAEERAMPRAAVVFETIRREGEGELSRTISALTFLGHLGRALDGLLALHDERVRGVSADTPWRPLVASFGYTVGFLIAILGRQQLLPRTRSPDPGAAAPVRLLWSVVRLWAIVIAGNLGVRSVRDAFSCVRSMPAGSSR
jgi:hypothetical protein